MTQITVNHTSSSVESIVIVDDEPNNILILESMLEDGGHYEVRSFSNGKSALESIMVMPPDLILLDIRMPKMDGIEVCRRIKAHKQTENIPVLFLSALTDPFEKVRAFEAGGVDYVTKPLNEAEVLAPR